MLPKHAFTSLAYDLDSKQATVCPELHFFSVNKHPHHCVVFDLQQSAGESHQKWSLPLVPLVADVAWPQITGLQLTFHQYSITQTGMKFTFKCS